MNTTKMGTENVEKVCFSANIQEFQKISWRKNKPFFFIKSSLPPLKTYVKPFKHTF